ncbi:HoxN/HupN/NixA family nickel/cobalt transporter [Pseudonocardia yunnanensis]
MADLSSRTTGIGQLLSRTTDAQRRSLSAMGIVIVALHVVGWGMFALLVAPQHLPLLGIGAAVTAYTLGMRHAFDADHISAIDNTTRKLMNEGRRPVSVGFWFALGHSTIVCVIGVGLTFAAKTVFKAVTDEHGGLHSFGGLIGTILGGGFLYLIAILNIVILVGILKLFFAMRRGTYSEEELEAQLENRGLMYRFFGRWMRTIDKEWKMYPVGIVFGLGFDTATEVALLSATAGAATVGLPWYAVLCLPILFTAGMTLLDSVDGAFMQVAYGWAFARPVRKVFYNIVITALSVALAFFIGSIELLGLLGQEFDLTGGIWDFTSDFDLNTAGFVIVGGFVVVWAIAVAIWRYGKIEERWESAAAHPSDETA